MPDTVGVVMIIQLIASDFSRDDGRDSEPMQMLIMDVL